MSIFENKFVPKIIFIILIVLFLGLCLQHTKVLADYCIKDGGTCTSADPHNNNCRIITSTTANGWDYCPSGTACIQSLYDHGAVGKAGCKYTGTTCASVGGTCQYDAYTCNNPGGHTYSGGNLDCGVGGSTNVCCISGSATDKSCTNKQGQCAPNGTTCSTSDPTHYTAFTEQDAECGTNNYCCYVVLKTTSPAGAPTAACGAGDNNSANNGWCGTDNNVYYCYQNVWHLKTTCSNGCQVNNGVADTCVGSNNGGSGPVIQPTTPTNTPVPSAPTATHIPATPTPPSGITTGTISVLFEGIDAVNNTKPKHLQRKLTLYFYNSTAYQNDPTSAHANYKYTDTLTFQGGNPNDSSSIFGIFSNSEFALGNIPSGNYYMLMKSPEGSLRELLSTQKIAITSGKNNVIIDTTSTNIIVPKLRMGDLNGDNLVNIIDYSGVIDCYESKTKQSSCTNHNFKNTTKGIFADVNDDGVVDGIDYNMILRNMDNHGY